MFFRFSQRTDEDKINLFGLNPLYMSISEKLKAFLASVFVRSQEIGMRFVVINK